MEEREWTPSQRLAIDTRDRTLLVSAAAGSGKTATLTERVIRSLLDDKKKTAIDELLIVTFTNAAARELRVKLSNALEDAAAKDPENAHLQRQLFMLPTARIRTIDAFCAEVLRANCDRVGVPPNYRIADTAEVELLARSVVDGLINSAIRGELDGVCTAEEFDTLSDCLSNSGTSESLSEVLCALRDKCDSSEFGVDSLLPLIERVDPEKYNGFEKSFFGEYIIKRLRELCAHYRSIYLRLYGVISVGASTAEVKYKPMAEEDMKLLSMLESAEDYEALHSVFSKLEFVAKPRGVTSKNHTPETSELSAVRDLFKKELTAMTKYFLYPPDGMKELFKGLHETLSVLYRFLKRFDGVFLEEKRKRGALSYADIERYTYACLVENGKPTDIALNMSRQFTAIYIDEYQDVNSLQNGIFKAIARDDNRFMVGDIKQSIYGFRQAEPEIFARMKRSFPALEREGEYTPAASIFMSDNFRCNRSIVDFVNAVFDKAFGCTATSIGYVSDDCLKYSKPEKKGIPPYRVPEICVLDKPENAPEPEDEDEEEIYVPDGAPEVVAKKIKWLIDNGRLDNGEKIKPSDIAILLRYSRGRDFRYAQALEEVGVSAEISGAGDFFLSSEVLLALCILNSIDNPRRDIYFAGLMCSPLFGFTADELYMIREEARDTTLYEATVEYVKKHPDFKKGARLISRLGYYRSISEGIPAHTLIYKIYRETGLLTLAASNEGRENLMMLYDYARSYEGGAFKGLYNFINFINNLIDKKTSFDDNRDTSESDAVKIVTCHSSKGLEYPIVFLVEAGAAYSNLDSRNRLAFLPEFGMGMRLRTPSGLALVNNPVREVINLAAFRKLQEEEMRVLYVALTRARERLYVVGTSPVKDKEEFFEKTEIKRGLLDSYSIFTVRSFLELIGVTVGISGRSTGPEEFLSRSAELEGEPPPPPEKDENEGAEDGGEENDKDPEPPPLTGEELIGELECRFRFAYPSRHLTTLPEKLSVSRTSPSILDGSEQESADEMAFLFDGSDKAPDAEEEKRPRLPRFVGGKEADESAKKGIATHYLLQFCDLENLRDGGAEAELTRLVTEGYISAKDGGRVRIPEIEAFRRSSLFRDMLKAKRLWRELRFNTRLPASLFTKEESDKELYKNETVLIQGVMDCVIEFEDGSFGIFDYKTDRLTRAERECRPLAEEKLRNAHKQQLNLYALAAESIFGKRPERIEVYSLVLGDTVDVTDSSIWVQ